MCSVRRSSRRSLLRATPRRCVRFPTIPAPILLVPGRSARWCGEWFGGGRAESWCAPILLRAWPLCAVVRWAVGQRTAGPDGVTRNSSGSLSFQRSGGDHIWSPPVLKEFPAERRGPYMVPSSPEGVTRNPLGSLSSQRSREVWCTSLVLNSPSLCSPRESGGAPSSHSPPPLPAPRVAGGLGRPWPDPVVNDVRCRAPLEMNVVFTTSQGWGQGMLALWCGGGTPSSHCSML